MMMMMMMMMMNMPVHGECVQQPQGGALNRKIYTRARMAPRKPLVAQHFWNPTLTGTKFGPKSITLVTQN